jgi:NADH dehydrogenase/NADH:ubiquinone oxidoreductase subunit G
LKRKRLDAPLSRKGETFYQRQWDEVFNEIAEKVQDVEGHEIAGAIGEFSDLESIVAFKDFLNSFDCFNYEFRRNNNIQVSPTFRSNYLFNSRIQGVQDADLILLVGVNVQYDAPLLNSRIMQSVRKGTTKVVVIGPPADYPYQYTHLGNDPKLINDLIDGKSTLSEELGKAKTPMIILGKDVLTREDSPSILNRCQELAVKSKFINPEIGWNGFNVLNRHVGEINALELGLDLTVKAKNPKVLFLLGADNNISKEDIPKDCFVVYIGTHGDEGAQYADVILPAAAYTEQSGTFGNYEVM